MSKKEGLRKRGIEKKSGPRFTESVHQRQETKGGCGVLARRCFVLTISVLCFGVAYAYYTSPLNSVVIDEVIDPSEIEWSKDYNTDLKKGIRILEDLIGPESLVIDDTGSWYTGLKDGRIIKISNPGTPAQVVIDLSSKLVNGPISTSQKNHLRRPLGLRIKQYILYVADAYQGMIAINLNTYTWEKLAGYSDVDPPIAFADDMVITEDGSKMYFTDMSVKWPYHEMAYMRVEGDCSGRIIELDLKTKVTKTLRDDICSPNGIELNPEESILIVSESARYRMLLLDVQSGKEISNVPLPGSPDNVRRANGGGYWVPIPTPPIAFLQTLRNFPFLRDISATILGPKWLFVFVNLNRGMVAKLNDRFEPIAIHYDTDGEISRSITEVIEVEDGFLLCSFIAPGIVKLRDLPFRGGV